MLTEKLPDDTAYLDGKVVRLTERELITIWRKIGPKGEWRAISFVASKAVPA